MLALNGTLSQEVFSWLNCENNVFSVSFVANSSSPSSSDGASTSTDFVYYSTASSSSTHYPLYRMDMYTKKETVLDSRAYRFRVDSKYLFVSRKNITGNKASDEVSRRLYVSQTYASSNVQFNEVQLPSLSDQQVSRVGGFPHPWPSYMQCNLTILCYSSMLSWQLMRWEPSSRCLMERVSFFFC